MTILAFWSVSSYEVERHTLDNVSDIEAFDILWHKRNQLYAVFFDMGTRSCSDPLGQYGIANASDFEEDYNNEDLDGGMWTRVMHLDKEDVLKIINE